MIIFISDENIVALDSRFTGYSQVRIKACNYNSCTDSGTWSEPISLTGGGNTSSSPLYSHKGGSIADAELTNNVPTASTYLPSLPGQAGVSGGGTVASLPDRRLARRRRT